MRLLYVEDSPTDADLARRALARALPAAEIAVTHDLAGARALLAGETRFDLALLDRKLPDGDGLELLAEIRARQLPIATVLLTGAGDEQTVIRALKLHADDYLMKRSDYLDRLPEVIEYALVRFRREHNLRSRPLAVLYAEHNGDDAELTRMHLARHAPHIRLNVVPGADTVLDWLDGENGFGCQVLLLDYRLLGMDALELIRTLRQRRRLDLPIVLITGRGSEEAAAAALHLGVSDYLIKEPGYLDRLPTVLEHAYAHAELGRERARLQYLATYDDLTGLLKRAEFRNRASQALSRAQRVGARCAVLLVDLDNFKLVNDSFGHAAGDLLLQDFANRLRQVLREEDLSCRFGGDEFLVLLERADQTGAAARTADRITESLAESFAVGGVGAMVNASIGIAMFPQDGEDIDTLVKNADTAMYKAKSGGRGHFRFFDAAMNAEVEERFRLEIDLRRALERREFFLVYQPQIDVESGQTVGVEALLRWRHPKQGLVAPDRFIPVAEAGGLIVPIGEWVLRESCRQLRAWDDQGLPPLRMAVNLSSRRFRTGVAGLGTAVSQALFDNGLPPSRLELELTESVMVDDPIATKAALDQIKGLGVSIALDDFGTGMTSLGRLKRLPIDRLKIDRGFVSEIGRDGNGSSVSAAVVGLARSLGMETVAEGVEEADQLSYLSDHGCPLAQGYAISPPLESQAFASWLEARAA